MQDALSNAFAEASLFLVDVVRLIPNSGWDRPGLGDWSVRELVAHANRGQTTVTDYLINPQPPEPPGSSYFSPELVAARGRDAVAALGNDPLASIETASVSVIRLVEQTPAHASVGSPAGTMTLAQYLPSRIAELTIHALDIGRAVQTELSVPPNALRESLTFVARRAAAKSGQDVLLALAGRTRLPDGYSAY